MLLERNGGSASDPIVVGAVGGAASPSHGADFLLGAGTFPFVDFGMAVGKGEAASTVVITGGEVAPITGNGIGIDEEVAVVDAVGMFVEESVNLGRVGDLAEPLELTVA